LGSKKARSPTVDGKSLKIVPKIVAHRLWP